MTSALEHPQIVNSRSSVDKWADERRPIFVQDGGGLLISYNSQALQEICFYPATAVKLLGEAAAISLQARHADIQAAGNVFELPVGEITVNRNVCTLTVPNVLSIMISPNYAAANDGAVLDWSTVGRVKLMGINNVG